MSTHAISGLVQLIGQYRLLEPGQQDELVRRVQGEYSEPRFLFRELIQRGWLTPYQANLILTSRTPELVLGSYILIERLRETVVGEMFKARHQHMRRTVALQVIRADLLTKPGAVEKFYEEIQAASQLTSPHIVAAYDAGPIGPTHFFAQEYVEGVDLDRLVQESGPLPVEQACDYTYQAASGLAHAFERGLLHHDLKPANLLIVARSSGPRKAPMAQSGKKQTGLGAGALLKIQNLGLTFICQQKRRTKLRDSLADTLIGTPDFIAPELTREGRLPDIRTEMYSLGCCLYYQLAGRVPFPGGSVADKLRRHQLEDPAPLETIRTDVPAEVRGLVRTLLAKQPEDRPATPAAVVAALAPLLPSASVTRGPIREEPEQPAQSTRDLDLSGVTETQPHPGRQPRSWAWYVLTGTGAAVFLSLLGVFLYLLFSQASLEGSASRDSARASKPGTDRIEDRHRPRNGRWFDGVGDHVSTPHQAALDPPQLTVATWLRLKEFPEGEDKRRWLFGKNVHEHTEGYFGLMIIGKRVGAYLNIGGGDKNFFQVFSAADVLTLADWHHLAMTYDGKLLKVYFDGEMVGQHEVNRPRVPGTHPLSIGRRPDGVTISHYMGWLDDIRLYNRALSVEEVKAMVEHPAGSGVREEGLVRYWRY